MTVDQPQPNSTLHIVRGLQADQTEDAIRFFWQAFSEKLRVPMGPSSKAHEFLRRAINPDHAICAVDQNSQLLGIAGFKSDDGAFIDGTLQDVISLYGPLSGLWRGFLLDFLRRDCEQNVFLMDGIFVDDQKRGQGVGRQLLNAIADLARETGCDVVRLDVIDTNTAARRLYERFGFIAVEDYSTGILRHVFGYSGATRMHLTL
ncbi:GNAT family N-acetyltransferase [Pseudaestuariivita rosea]|uniref:GNAT family N-acetyltransferase n=1 Tax=Pseudaestuariivita rosea TaxID=2763263 RepID=UPI001ABBA840|nr:GNAT family N-acetyltransferase [Pseudaestuariivita rosea]